MLLSSQLLRQTAAAAAHSAAETAAARAAQSARLRASEAKRHQSREAARAIERAHDYAAVRTGADYERFVAAILTAANIPVVRVGRSGDLGADLLVQSPSGPIVLQCKFYTHPVGYDAVKEAYTAKALYKATAAYVVINTTYTPQARRTAKTLNISLTHHADLLALLA